MYFYYKDFKLYYETHGNHKKSILILPGWGDTRKTFSYMIAFLKQFYTVYIIDWPGFGNSTFPDTHLTIYDYAELIHHFIKEKIKSPILIGHSFGGRIILLLLGYYHKQYSKVVLIDAAGIKPKKTLIQKWKQWLYKSLKLLRYLLPKRKRKKYLEKLITLFGSKDYNDLNPYMRKTFSNIVEEDLTHLLKEVESEVLLIWGKEDMDTPLKDAKKMNKAIKESSLIVLPGTHFVYLQNSNLVNAILYEYFK